MVRTPLGAPNVETIRDELLAARELATHLGVRPGTVLGWHRQGKIPSRRLSHKVLRFSLRDVLAALEARPAAVTRDGRGRVPWRRVECPAAPQPEAARPGGAAHV
jgi:hypothetical protein